MAYSIFIVKNNVQALKQAETYLKNRKWKVASAVNMREALAYIIQKKPEFVLICSDHPNKKVAILPKLLVQAFQVKIIVFTESNNPAVIHALREMGQKNTIFPPVSGPAIERMVLKIKKQEAIDAENAQAQKEALAANPNLKIPADSINVSSGTLSEGPDVMTFKNDGSDPQGVSALEQARAALSQLVNSKEDDDSSSTGSGAAYVPSQNEDSETDSDSGMFIAKGAGHKKGAAYMGSSTTTESGPNITQEGLKKGKAAAITQEGGVQGDLGELTQEGLSSIEYFEKQNAAKTEDDDSAVDGPSENPFAKKTKKNSIQKNEETAEFNDDGELYIQGELKRNIKNESLVIKGAVEALDKSVVKNKNIARDKVNKIESSTNVACIAVESPRFSGYLVAALGKNRKIDAAFMEMVKSRLFGFLKANGEPVNDQEAMGINVKEVEFEGWAVEQAEFLKKTVHDGDEIAMAFFPSAEVATKFEDSARENMAMMSMDELKSDVALEFDLYMYMPENDKYILYTPQGRPFYGNQKDRLSSKGIKNMHLRKESMGDAKKYRAQNYLNEKIEAFKMAKKNEILSPHLRQTKVETALIVNVTKGIPLEHN